jgi:fermentation-respiration switch protein FrsA (DUF1100 family)
MAHGFSATRDLRLPAYAERFQAAGLGVLVFDYRHFGDSGGQPRQLLDIARQLADWRRAVAHARRIDWVDPARVALFGTSFGGGHVVKLAAEDQTLAAIVMQCPFQDGLATLPKLGAVNLAKAAAHGILDQVGAVLGRPPHYVPAIAAPGDFALMATADSKSGWDRLLAPGTTWENRVAARIGLRVGLYRPGRLAPRVSCPALYCICDRDTLVPARTTTRLAGRAPRGEVLHYPIGHFDIYVGEWFERAVADQTEFLTRHLLG